MSIDWFTFGAQIVNFVVLVGLLNHFLYGPITQAISDREKSFADKLHSAEQRESEAQVELKNYQALSNEMESQRATLLKAANEESEQVRKKLLAEARHDVQFRREEWLDSLHRDRRLLVNSLRQKVGEQIIEVSRNALNQLANTEIEDRSLEQFVAKLSELSSVERQRLKLDADAHIHTPFSIGKQWQERIETTLAQELGLRSVSFVTTPSLILGVELHVGGNKIGWSVQEFLDALSDELEMTLEKA